MEGEDLFLKGSAERRQSTLLGSMEDREETDEKHNSCGLKSKSLIKCCQTYWLERFPVITWIRNYQLSFLAHDLIAGVTVGLTAIPQGVAYAIVAGLEPQYGLYSGYMGGFIYFLLGTVKDITIGPTAIMALLVQSHVEKFGSDFAVLLCFLSGCITLLLGILHLGFLVNFISLPVTVGFTTAAALTIASSQLKSLLGIPGKSTQFMVALISTFRQISKTRFEDLSLGLVTIAFLVGMKILNEKLSRRHKNLVSASTSTRWYVVSVKFISLGKNAVAVIIATLLAYILSVNGLQPFTLTGKVGHGFPKISAPPFSTHVRVGNQTITLPFEAMLRIMKTSIISVPLLSVLETITIGKIFAKGHSLNATQEMVALGVCNILGSFSQSMPTAGSFTRSVINNASGVKTPLAGVFTGMMVLSALALTATFEYIPKASLAGVILTAMYYMIDYHEFVLIWRANRLDMIPLCVTIVFCLAVELDIGILLGIIVNFFFILYINIKPKIAQEELTVRGEEIVVFRIHQSPVYPGAEYVRNTVMKFLKLKKKALVVIDGTHMLQTDSTTIKTFKVLAENLKKYNQEYAFWNWPSEYKTLYSRVDEELLLHFHDTDTVEQLLEVTILKNTERND